MKTVGVTGLGGLSPLSGRGKLFFRSIIRVGVAIFFFTR